MFSQLKFSLPKWLYLVSSWDKASWHHQFYCALLSSVGDWVWAAKTGEWLLSKFYTAQRRGLWELGPQTWREVAREFQNWGLIAGEQSALLCLHQLGFKSRETDPAPGRQWGLWQVCVFPHTRDSPVFFLLLVLSGQQALTSFRLKRYFR